MWKKAIMTYSDIYLEELRNPTGNSKVNMAADIQTGHLLTA
jgi:hypothetical protein